ncbi:MAG: hypothetical protein H7Y89_13955 [Steroidobacteraceae bacterium]|nr:hypothetical protein [Steroidobacteraceae bacterium]
MELALESLFGESVRNIKVIQYSIYVRFHWRAIATTRPDRIYLRGSGKEFFADGPLVLHEYFHVIRQWATGDLTIPRYLAECFRRGYWDNHYEIEAREYTATEIFRYRALLAQHRTSALPANVRRIRAHSA